MQSNDSGKRKLIFLREARYFKKILERERINREKKRKISADPHINYKKSADKRADFNIFT